jgi:hypothetical protein
LLAGGGMALATQSSDGVIRPSAMPTAMPAPCARAPRHNHRPPSQRNARSPIRASGFTHASPPCVQAICPRPAWAA